MKVERIAEKTTNVKICQLSEPGTQVQTDMGRGRLWTGKS